MREERRTLTRYTIESEHRHPGSTGDFSGLLNAVATAVKIISNQVNRGALVGGLIGYFLDHWLHTKPYLMIIVGALGFFAAVRDMLRRLQKSSPTVPPTQ